MNQKDELRTELNDKLKIESGSVSIDNKLTGFLYDLMKDYLTPGVVEKLARDAEINHKINNGSYILYSNGWLAKYAENLANRLTK